MSFKLGVVGHKNTLSLVSEVVDEYFSDVEISSVEFSNDDNIENIIPVINATMNICDGMLYSRYEPYSIVSKYVTHTIPARYVDINSSHLIASMLRGVVQFGSRLDNLSIDSFEHKAALDACLAVGLKEKDITLNTFYVDLKTERFVRETLTKHIENYEAGATLCITNISAVCASLIKENIPATVIVPGKEAFVSEIRNLMLQHKLRISSSENVAVISATLKYKEKFRFYRDMPLREIDELATTKKFLTIFAENIDGILIQRSVFDYLIVGEDKVLKQITDEFLNIPVMQKIVTETAFDVKLGIGLGENLKSAYSNSNMAMTHSENHIGSNAFIMYDSSKLYGPVTPINSNHTPDSGLDEKLFKIATDTGISFVTIHKIYQISHTRSVTLFTSLELADLLDVTRRTVNRFIEKLIDCGYASISGRSIVAQKGRPSRVIKIMF